MLLEQREHNCAILLGTTSCPADPVCLFPVPSVAINIQRLSAYLQDYYHTIKQLLDPPDYTSLLKEIELVAAQTRGCLWFYYAGHALDRDNGLRLCTPASESKHWMATTVAFAEIARILASSPARKKILVLDCCHAEAGLLNTATLESHIATDGTFAIAAAQRTEGAKIGNDGEPTKFTGELLEILNNGPSSRLGNFNALDVKRALGRSLQAAKTESGQKRVVAFNIRGKGEEIIVGKVAPISYDELLAFSMEKPSAKELPRRAVKCKAVLGPYRAWLLVKDLKRWVEGVRGDIVRWVSTVRNDPGNADPVAIHRGLAPLVGLVAELENQARSYQCWPLYCRLVENVHRDLDQFYSTAQKTAEGNLVQFDPTQVPPSLGVVRDELRKLGAGVMDHIHDLLKEIDVLIADIYAALE